MTRNIRYFMSMYASALLASAFLLCSEPAFAGAETLTFFGWSDQHVKTDGSGEHLVPAIDAMNAMPGTGYPLASDGKVDEPAFVFGLGDITEWPTRAARDTYNKLITGRLKFPSYDVAGNHDSGGLSPSPTIHDWLIRRHGSLSYTFDAGGVHFVVLYSAYDDSLNSPAQPITKKALDYLSSALAKLPAGSPVVVATHLCFDAITNRDELVDAFGDANIILVLGGHYHKAVVNRYRGFNFVQLPSPAPGSPSEFTVFRISSDRLVAIPFDYSRKTWSLDDRKTLDVKIHGPARKVVEEKGLRASEGLSLENVVSPGPNRADEPLAESFSMDKAVRFLDSASLTWQKQRKCFACHSNYAFLMARPAVAHNVTAHKQIREAAERLAMQPRKTYYQSTEAIMVASVLAQNDAATTGKLHPATRQALDYMWKFQREDGGWKWLNENEPPSEIEEHYGVTMAAIGVGLAPDDYSQTPAAKEGLEKIRKYFRNNPPLNMHHRTMKMLASLNIDGILTDTERKDVIRDLFALQKPDGGWNLATLGRNWKRTDGAAQDYDTSDGYGTGFVIYALRTAGVAADDPRIRNGIKWLKTNQRASGRWFTRSMDKDSKNYITHSGTAYAILALAACGETAATTPTPAAAAQTRKIKGGKLKVKKSGADL